MKHAAIFWALCLGGNVCVRAFAADAGEPSLEYRVKAAFLLNFTKFVEWPATSFASPESPLAICILGQDSFGNELDRIVEGEIVNGHRVVVERLRRAPVPKTCHVLFLGVPEAERAKVISGLGGDVLTVGEGEGFLREGGMIAFVIEDRRVRFSVNLRRASERGELKISSKLLNVARSVQK